MPDFTAPNAVAQTRLPPRPPWPAQCLSPIQQAHARKSHVGSHTSLQHSWFSNVAPFKQCRQWASTPWPEKSLLTTALDLTPSACNLHSSSSLCRSSDCCLEPFVYRHYSLYCAADRRASPHSFACPSAQHTPGRVHKPNRAPVSSFSAVLALLQIQHVPPSVGLLHQ